MLESLFVFRFIFLYRFLSTKTGIVENVLIKRGRRACNGSLSSILTSSNSFDKQSFWFLTNLFGWIVFPFHEKSSRKASCSSIYICRNFAAYASLVSIFQRVRFEESCWLDRVRMLLRIFLHPTG